MKSKLRIIVSVVILIAVIAAKPVDKPYDKWQDFLSKPTFEWLQRFGYDAESHLAYHVALLHDQNMRLSQKVSVLEKKVDSLLGQHTVDPNTPKEETKKEDNKGESQ